ncbi:hypothetical protein K402DRAFT_100065 [Aulographum hederae CBS 113979]|uniref:Protein NO VEIN C-terminal domain-containing protein n=1 Tax=Aulographum hederae CBS 113979 TaxID=1176131 RepID=A0A6G1GYB4_9PEZI|nr:hypothetical protein K402DRAFT_100065 [Aulographum hederae CBS 113979]
MFVFAGYLASEVWANCTPTYFIEVKTTLGTLDTPFLCTQGQYDKMERMRPTATVASDEIYIVARVFQLGHSGMGWKLYLDPAELRRRRELSFKADVYEVTPL